MFVSCHSSGVIKYVLSPEIFHFFKRGWKETLENGSKIFSHFWCFALLCCFLDPTRYWLIFFLELCLFAFLLTSTNVKKGKVAEHLPLSWHLWKCFASKNWDQLSPEYFFSSLVSPCLLSYLLVFICIEECPFSQAFWEFTIYQKKQNKTKTNHQPFKKQ